MEKLSTEGLTRPMSTTTTNPHPARPAGLSPEQLAKVVSRRFFCTLATVSASDRPHVAGVLYASVGGDLFVSTRRTSRKARNVAANPHVFVCIPVRRVPVGPPASVQFAATAEVLALDDPQILRLVETGRLKGITGHGELDLPDGCFLHITPSAVVHTYGLGLPLRRLLRDPLNAGGKVALAPVRSGP